MGLLGFGVDAIQLNFRLLGTHPAEGDFERQPLFRGDVCQVRQKDCPVIAGPTEEPAVIIGINESPDAECRSHKTYQGVTTMPL